MSTPKPSLSIITATFQSAKWLPDLIVSLQKQTNQDFEWVVVDGNSTDGTVELLKQIKDISISWASEPDFGIYDAMNKGVKRSKADYYLVVGSDDILEITAVKNIIADLQENKALDVLVGQVYVKDGLRKRKTGLSSIYGAAAFVTSHSVGTVFKKNLHDRFGYYNNHYPILADSYFIKKIFQSNAIIAKYSDNIYGRFNTNGISNTEVLRCHVENLHIQLVTEKFKFFQILIFIARYIKFRLR